jgi:hypothetical protein
MLSKIEAPRTTSDAPIFEPGGGCLKALSVTRNAHVGNLLSALYVKCLGAWVTQEEMSVSAKLRTLDEGK